VNHTSSSWSLYIGILLTLGALVVREAGRKPPPYPFIFLKARQSIVDHDADVIIPKIAQDMQPDYEGELCFVMGKDAKDIKPEDAFQYIAAFTAGNDVSTRRLQRDPEFAGVVPQWGFSKGFDTFAPLGPVLVRSDILGDPKKARLSTRIDGELRQDELVDDLLFDCAYLVSYLSSGTTLEKGSVIMTGTPGGKDSWCFILPHWSPFIPMYSLLTVIYRSRCWYEASTMAQAWHCYGGARGWHWDLEKQSRFRGLVTDVVRHSMILLDFRHDLFPGTTI
jgi:hypothetical protein